MSGQKVTTDPLSQSQPIQEGTGVVTSDSLAAKSLRDSGAFGNPSAAAMSVPSASSTAATTDTSAAVEIPAAADKSSRQTMEPFSDKAELEAGRVAPPPEPLQRDVPKGKGLTEGGISGEPNASFSTDIGGRKDPGRLAVEQIQRQAAEQAGAAGRPRDAGVSGDGQFDVLKDAPA